MGLLDSFPGLLEILRNSAQGQNMNAGIGADAASYAQQPPPGLVPQMPPPVIMAQQDQPQIVDRNQPSPMDSAQWPAGPVGAPSQKQPIMADNQPSPLDSARWPAGPVGAPSNANASMPPPSQAPLSMAPPQQPVPAPSQSPGIGDRLMAGLQGFSGGMQKGVLSGLTGAATGLATGAQPVSATEQALLAKGVDPTIVKAARDNPEVMKTLVTQTFGPQTKTSIGEGYVTDPTGNVTRAYTPDKAPTSLGEGHVYNPVTKKVEVAYEPADKIPAGFVKADDGSMKFIPGGPADPAYLRLAEAQKKDPTANIVLGRGGEIIKNNPDGSVTVVHKNEADAPVPMDPAALEILARREIGGDFSGRKNFGRGAQGAADLKAITNKAAEILAGEMGMSPTEAAAHLLKKQQEFTAQGQGLNSEARTSGVREANLNLILKAADAAIPAALEASDKVGRTGWVPLNKVIQGGQVIASDPDLKKFGMANLQLAEHWARAMNPTGVMRESDRDMALHFLSTADSKDTYREAVGQLRTQIERERDAVKATRGMASMPGAPAPTTPAAAPAPGAYVWTPGSGLVGGK